MVQPVLRKDETQNDRQNRNLPALELHGGYQSITISVTPCNHSLRAVPHTYHVPFPDFDDNTSAGREGAMYSCPAYIALVQFIRGVGSQ